MRVQLIQLNSAIAIAREHVDRSTEFAKTIDARVLAASVATEIAQLAHQPHGAIGVTAEYTLHPVTRTLWAARDADLPEDCWARLPGLLNEPFLFYLDCDVGVIGRRRPRPATGHGRPK